MNDVRVEATIRTRNAHLYYARIKEGLNQTQAAEFCGITQSRWSAFELMTSWPTIEVQKQIAEAFGCDRSELFPEEMRETAGFTIRNFRDVDIMEFQELRGKMPLLIADDNPQEDAERSELEKDMLEALKRLTPRERFVVDNHEDMSLANSDGMTLDELGEHLLLTKERVRQIREKAYWKLRRVPKLREHAEEV